jgi:hypothetical protein
MQSSVVLALAVVATLTVAVTSMSVMQGVDDLSNGNMALAERELGTASEYAKRGENEKRACFDVCISFIIGRGCVRWGKSCKRDELEQRSISEGDYALEAFDKAGEGTEAIGKRAPACYRVCLSFLIIGGCARWGSTCRRELTAETLPASEHIPDPKNCYYQCASESASGCTRMELKCANNEDAGEK